MSKYAMLSLDLNLNTFTDSRAKFNDGLAAKNWVKSPALTTLWWSSWDDAISDERIVSADGAANRPGDEVAQRHEPTAVALVDIEAHAGVLQN